MKAKSKHTFILFVIGVALFMSAQYAASLFVRDVDKVKQSEWFAQELDRKTTKALQVIVKLQNEILRYGTERAQLRMSSFLEELHETEGISIVVFENDELVLWSDNKISPTRLWRVAARGTEIHNFDNGWYRVLHRTDGITEYCCAILLKNTYPYENDYLDNTFQNGFNVRSIANISNNSSRGSVKLKANHQFFYLTYEDTPGNRAARKWTYILFSLLGGVSLLIALTRWMITLSKKKSPWVVYLGYALIVFALRYLSVIAGWPSYVSSLDLFNPAIYASSQIFPSLIDFCINTGLLVVIISVGRFAIIPQLEIKKSSAMTAAFSLMTVALFLYGTWINKIGKGLVLNSNIPFDINNVLGLNSYSFLSLAGTAALYFSFYLAADGVLNYISKSEVKKDLIVLIIAVLTLISVVIQHFMGVKDLIFVLWPPILLLVIFYFQSTRIKSSSNLLRLIIITVFFAGVASHNFIKYSSSREHSQREILADKLSVDDDPVAELLYTDLSKQITRNNGVRNVFEENELHTRETLEDYVLSRFFTGYWSKYDIKMYAFLSDSSHWGKMPAVRPVSFSDIQKRIEKYGEPSPIHPDLYYMYNAEDYTTYMAILPLHYSLSTRPDGFFVFEMSSKLFPQQLGFPSLLIDKSSRANREAIPYASARYVGDKLIYSRGDFSFKATPGFFNDVKEGKQYIKRRGFEHLVTRVDHATIVVLSTPLLSPLDKATTFSYLSIIFGFVIWISLIGYTFIIKQKPLTFNLNLKIQALLIILTITSLFFFSFATKYYIEEKYTEKNKRQISEKMQSILLELKGKMGEEESLNYDMSDILNRLLSQFSSVFFTDINLYSPEGDLLASSQIRMYNEGLVSRKINPRAYAHVNFLDAIEYIHEERIGNLNYISGYTPFYNDRDELLAYINLPYFAKQSELEEEVSNFLVSVINVFVLLFLLSILVGLFISQWITSPLRYIRESLAGIELGKTNKLIGYKGTDEIGLLVKEYNLKVSELEHNAEKLAQSERESAWREMAKQVAHEIKNPLTPMKLNIQHLERNIERTGEVDSSQVKRLAENLIEQIDALSAIANAFSNFAQMPQANVEKIDLVKLLEGATNLYDNFDYVSFSNLLPQKESARVIADKKQLIRVFNNLIKNAIQAVDTLEKGEVKINLNRGEAGYLVQVIDNGKGIKEEDRNKIFVPNFTTKSRGMGLGLAMTKNIVENSGGKIWFESKEGEGSVFYVWLPEINELADSQ